MKISAAAIRNPIAPLVLFTVLAFMGFSAFKRLPIDLMPDVTVPVVNVSISQPGAAPVEIARQILEKVEGGVAGVVGVKNIESRATEGLATVSVEFQVGTRMDRAVTDVRDAVARVRPDLPATILEPQIQREDGNGSIATYAVSTTSLSLEQLSWVVDSTVSKGLLGVPGVARVSRSGGVEREIRVDLYPERLQALGVTVAQINEHLRTLNEDPPGGRAEIGGREQSVRVLGSADSAQTLGARQIDLGNGRVIRLSDIAAVTDGTAEIRSLARFNGRPATTFDIYKAQGYSDVATLDAAERKLHQISAANPDIALQRIYTTVDNTKDSFEKSMRMLIEGAVLAVVVVFLFLREWRVTVIAALAIPLSVIPTFAVMSYLGFTLNFISLLALSLVSGVLVDDAIVEVENIVRHINMGKSVYQAAVDAADEIGLAVVATSATIIAVFLPVSFMPGFTGQYFKQFGLTVSTAVFFSLLVARLVTPVLAAYALNRSNTHAHGEGTMGRGYQRLLDICIRHRWKALAGGALLLLASLLAIVVLVPISFLPAGDNSTANLHVELPPGARLADTANVMAQATVILRQQPEVISVVETAGADEDNQVRTGQILISLVPIAQRKLNLTRWKESVEPLLKTIPDAQISFSGGGNNDITVMLVGTNGGLLDQKARELVTQMHALREVRNAGISGDLPRPEILVSPHFEVAAQLGVSVEAISQTIRVATLGDPPQLSAKFALPDRQVPIRVSLVAAARQDLSVLANLPVPASGGRSVPLKAVADLSFGQGPTSIRRHNQEQRVLVTADLNHGTELGDATTAIRKLPVFADMPRDVRVVWTGGAESMDELFGNFLLAGGAGVLIVFAILVLLFSRLFQPVTILAALPLSIPGVAIALLYSGHAMSLSVLIGMLMLMGIVTKNSILLVDCAIEEIRHGKSRHEALLAAGALRAQPIVMTSIAMIAGMLPVALGIGGGDTSFREPMAVAVIGGIVTSTALTLLLVPALFTVVDDLEAVLGPWTRRLLLPAPPVAALASPAAGNTEVRTDGL